jgi:hypothetical protein
MAASYQPSHRKVNGAQIVASGTPGSTRGLKEFRTVDERSDDTASRGGTVEQFLAMLGAELLALLIYRLIQIVFGIELPRRLAKLAA